MSQFIEMFENVESYCKLEDLISDTFPGEWGSEPISENAIKVIRTTNFTNEGYLDLTDVVTRDIEPKKVVRKKLKQGDTILERSGGTKDNPVGRVVFFDEIGDYLPNNFTQVLRPKESVNPVYLFYALYNSYNLNKAAMRAMASQTTGIQNLSMSDFMAKSIVLPSRDEQNKFEQIYRQADKSEFVGFKSQFIEMFGNPVANNKGWSTMALKQVAPEEPSRERQTGTVWILNLDMIESHTGKIIDKVYDEDTNLLSVAPFDEGNVLYSKLRPYLNKVVIPKGKGYATTELVPLRPNQEYLNLTFFSHLLRGDDFVTYANTISSGTKMPRMPLNDLRNFQCILPPMEEQLKFEKVAEQADKSEYYN